MGRNIHSGRRPLLLAVMLLLGVVREGLSEEFVYQKGDRDPFWPLVTEDGKLVHGFEGATFDEMNLEGIVWDPEGDSLAMISGLILRRGDRIGKIEILEIERERVIFRIGKKRRFLELEKDF